MKKQNKKYTYLHFYQKTNRDICLPLLWDFFFFFRIIWVSRLSAKRKPKDNSQTQLVHPAAIWWVKQKHPLL